MNDAELVNTESIGSRMVLVRGRLSLLAGDVTDLTKEEIASLKSKFLTLKNVPGRGRYSQRGYKPFPEKGPYILASILKDTRAIEAAISIVETYAA